MTSDEIRKDIDELRNDLEVIERNINDTRSNLYEEEQQALRIQLELNEAEHDLEVKLDQEGHNDTFENFM